MSDEDNIVIVRFERGPLDRPPRRRLRSADRDHRRRPTQRHRIQGMAYRRRSQDNDGTWVYEYTADTGLT
jgi:hypothetical protein